jgi:hypothetical protein
MTTTPTHQPNHLHFFNHHTGRPRFHFDEASDAAAAATAPLPLLRRRRGIFGQAVARRRRRRNHRPRWQLKGWKLDDPKEAFGAAAEALPRGSRSISARRPTGSSRLPAADAKPEDIRAYHERLGAPKEAKDYDLTAVKDPAIADPLRATLHERGVPKDAAAAVAATVAKALESITATTTVLDAGKLAEQKANLEKNWGGKDSSTYQLNHLQRDGRRAPARHHARGGQGAGKPDRLRQVMEHAQDRQATPARTRSSSAAARPSATSPPSRAR